MGTAVWASERWLAQAQSWLDDQLGAAGIARTGPVTQPHLKPWSTVLMAPTSRGSVWLKAPGPDTVFEVELYRLLIEVAPSRVLTPIAVDTERGWIVLPDGGPLLAENLDGLTEALVQILPQYGQLQRELMPHVDRLLSLGVADMRAPAMPERFEQAMEAVSRYRDRHGTADHRETYRRVVELRPTFTRWCAQLAESRVGPSLDHGDLHPWNIFCPATGPDGARVYDWGDSVVAHPFASMLVGLGFPHRRLGLRVDSPELRRIRDAYLEVFSDLADPAELVAELELSCWVAKVSRVLIWDRALRAEGDEQSGEYADAPLSWLGSLLADSHLGRAD